MASTSSRDKPLPPISKPMRLQRSKSTSTTPRSSSAPQPSSKSKRGSLASGSSKGSKSGASMMRTIIQILNTPLVEPEYRRRSRSSLSDSSSIFPRFRRSEEKKKADDEPPTLRHLKSSSSLRSTTMSLLSDYDQLRNSIMSGSAVGLNREEIVASATRYYESMSKYLEEIDALPPAVRDTLEVQRLQQQLKFTVDLLRPSKDDEQSEQAVLLLDNTLMLVKQLLSDVQRLLLQHSLPSPVTEEDEHDDDDWEHVQGEQVGGKESSSTEGEFDFDIPDAHLAILITEPDDGPPNPVHGGLRKMRSSMAMLGGGSSRAQGPGRDSGYVTAEDSLLESPIEERSQQLFINRKVRFTLLHNRTRDNLSDISHSVEDVAGSLTAINACSLFAGGSRSETPVTKPVDTADVTYGQDGTPVAMSPAAIVEQLIQDLGLLPGGKKEPPIPNFSDIIFTTFRFFWMPEDFLEHLENAYDNTYFNDRKLSVVLLVRLWVLAYWLPQDSRQVGLIKKVQRFLGKALTDGFVWGSILIDLLARLERYLGDPDRPAIIRYVPEMQYEPMPWRLIDFTRDMPLIRRSFRGIRIMSFNNSVGCMEFARQLTLKESALYLQLSAREVISRFVAADHAITEAAVAREKMDKLKDFSCIVYRWAAWNILRRSTPTKRARAFGFMMRLAKYLLSIRNFSSAHSVFNGAMSIHLDMLFQTEADILPKARRNMTYITNFFDENREISMQSSAQPTVPIMATYAGKLARLLEAKGVMSPSKVDPSVDLINVSFFRAATRITYAMESNQHPYDFKAHAPLQEFIDFTFREVPSEDEIYEQYLKVKREEQSGALGPKSSLLRRLRTNSMMTLPKFS